MVLATAAHSGDHVGCVGRWEACLVARCGGPAGFLGQPRGAALRPVPCPWSALSGGGSREQALGGGNCPGRRGVFQLRNTSL